MYWLLLVIVGIVIYFVASAWFAKGKDLPGGWISLLLASLVGAWLGDVVLGDWWLVAGYNLVAGIIGALVLTWLWSLVGKKGQAA